MSRIVLHYGHHPEQNRQYNGEHIYKVKEIREQKGVTRYCLEHGGWIKKVGDEKYETDWCSEERWARAVEVGDDGEEKELGFIIARVDRSKGYL